MTSPKIRKNLLKLDKVELQELNDGFEALMSVEGTGGYQQLAGLNGEPGPCFRPSDALIFLPWHRAYLLAFEQTIHRWLPELSLAYWDWTAKSTFSRGIPGRLRSVGYADKDQGVWLNQLCRAPVDCLGHERLTERAPGEPADLEPLAKRLESAMALDQYNAFAEEVTAVALAVRKWIGGHSADEDYAAYDPIFWFFHAGIDRSWHQWQQTHPDAKMSDALLAAELAPFAVHVRDVVDLAPLGFTYT